MTYRRRRKRVWFTGFRVFQPVKPLTFIACVIFASGGYKMPLVVIRKFIFPAEGSCNDVHITNHKRVFTVARAYNCDAFPNAVMKHVTVPGFDCLMPVNDCLGIWCALCAVYENSFHIFSPFQIMFCFALKLISVGLYRRTEHAEGEWLPLQRSLNAYFHSMLVSRSLSGYPVM